MSFWEWALVVLWSCWLNSSLTERYKEKMKRTFRPGPSEAAPEPHGCRQNHSYSGMRGMDVITTGVQLSSRNITTYWFEREAAFAVLALCAETHDGMERKAEDSWTVLLCSSFVFLHLQLTVPPGSRDQALSSGDPAFPTNTLRLPSHLHPLCSRSVSPADGWRGLLWRRSVGTLLVLVSELKLCLWDRLEHPG